MEETPGVRTRQQSKQAAVTPISTKKSSASIRTYLVERVSRRSRQSSQSSSVDEKVTSNNTLQDKKSEIATESSEVHKGNRGVKSPKKLDLNKNISETPRKKVERTPKKSRSGSNSSDEILVPATPITRSSSVGRALRSRLSLSESKGRQILANKKHISCNSKNSPSKKSGNKSLNRKRKSNVTSESEAESPEVGPKNTSLSRNTSKSKKLVSKRNGNAAQEDIGTSVESSKEENLSDKREENYSSESDGSKESVPKKQKLTRSKTDGNEREMSPSKLSPAKRKLSFGSKSEDVALETNSRKKNMAVSKDTSKVETHFPVQENIIVSVGSSDVTNTSKDLLDVNMVSDDTSIARGGDRDEEASYKSSANTTPVVQKNTPSVLVDPAFNDRKNNSTVSDSFQESSPHKSIRSPAEGKSIAVTLHRLSPDSTSVSSGSLPSTPLKKTRLSRRRECKDSSDDTFEEIPETVPEELGVPKHHINSSSNHEVVLLDDDDASNDENTVKVVEKKKSCSYSDQPQQSSFENEIGVENPLSVKNNLGLCVTNDTSSSCSGKLLSTAASLNNNAVKQLETSASEGVPVTDSQVEKVTGSEQDTPQSPDSHRLQSPKSLTPQSPKSLTSQSPKSHSPQSPNSHSPQSPKSCTPQSLSSPKKLATSALATSSDKMLTSECNIQSEEVAFLGSDSSDESEADTALASANNKGAQKDKQNKQEKKKKSIRYDENSAVCGEVTRKSDGNKAVMTENTKVPNFITLDSDESSAFSVTEVKQSEQENTDESTENEEIIEVRGVNNESENDSSEEEEGMHEIEDDDIEVIEMEVKNTGTVSNERLINKRAGEGLANKHDIPSTQSKKVSELSCSQEKEKNKLLANNSVFSNFSVKSYSGNTSTTDIFTVFSKEMSRHNQSEMSVYKNNSMNASKQLAKVLQKKNIAASKVLEANFNISSSDVEEIVNLNTLRNNFDKNKLKEHSKSSASVRVKSPVIGNSALFRTEGGKVEESLESDSDAESRKKIHQKMKMRIAKSVAESAESNSKHESGDTGDAAGRPGNASFPAAHRSSLKPLSKMAESKLLKMQRRKRLEILKQQKEEKLNRLKESMASKDDASCSSSESSAEEREKRDSASRVRDSFVTAPTTSKVVKQDRLSDAHSAIKKRRKMKRSSVKVLPTGKPKYMATTEWTVEDLPRSKDKLRRLPDVILNKLTNFQPRRLPNGGNTVEEGAGRQKQAKRKHWKETGRNVGGFNVATDADFIPMKTGTTVQFGVMPLDRMVKAAPALAKASANFRNSMLYGDRVQREPAKALMDRQLKLKAAGKDGLVRHYHF